MIAITVIISMSEKPRSPRNLRGRLIARSWP